MASENLTFKKPNSALVMMPKVGNLTAISRKLFNVLLKETLEQLPQIQKTGMSPEDVLKFLFKARLSELVEYVETGSSNLADYSKELFREMRRVELDWEAPDANSEVVFHSMSLLSEIKITKERGVLFVEWAFPPSLMQVVIDPTRFTPIDITQLAKLKTYTAVALYEIASRYRNNPSGVTSEQPIDWWINALSQNPSKIDKATKLPASRSWPRFKNEHLKVAIQEINLKSDLRIELMPEKKTSRKFTSAQFKVARNTSNTALSTAAKMSPDIAQLATKLGLSLSDISNLISQGQSESVLKVAFSKLEARFARKDLAPIDSRLAYLRSVLAETNQYVSDKPVAPKQADLAVSSAPKITPIAEPQSFKERRRSEIKVELINLPKEQQQIYAETVLEKLRVDGLANPSNKRKVEAGDWAASPLLISKMIEAYAVEQYGADWGVESEKEEILL